MNLQEKIQYLIDDSPSFTTSIRRVGSIPAADPLDTDTPIYRVWVTAGRKQVDREGTDPLALLLILIDEVL